MEIIFKIGVVAMLLALSIGYIETRVQHKKAVETHMDLTDKIQNFVEQKLEHVVLPAKHVKK
jgi:hypothetical protein